MKRTLVALLAATALCHADNMKAFPPADEGMTRHVIHLPAAENEQDMKVELIVGKSVSVDPVNRHFLGGKIEEETIEGWGFTRYLVRKIGPLAGTRMAPPPGAPNVERFVTLGGDPFLVRYNSRLPVVVYVPADAELRYRIWRADEKAESAPKG